MELTQRMHDTFVRLQLSADLRKEVYTLLAFMLDNGNKLDESLKELLNIYSKDGKRPGNAVAVFLYEALQRTKDGRPLSEAVARYVSAEESSMIAAGERSGRLRESFGYAIDNIEKQKDVRRAVIRGVTYPLFLMSFLVILLWIVSYKLMPTLAKAVDLSMLTGPAGYLNLIAHFVTEYGLYVAVSVASIVAWAVWSLPMLTGNIRYRLDKLPPWSVYRAMQGSAFLLNVGVMLRSGIPLLTILNLLNKNASPYMTERIEACIRGTNAGLNLGDAMLRAELDFPDPMAVRLIRVFASRDGFDVALDSFAKQWAESTVKRVQAAMTWINMAALLAVGCVLILLVLSMSDLQSVMGNAAQQR